MQADSEIQPWGEEAADLRIARLECTIAEPYRDKKRHPKPFTVDEFMPKYDAVAEEEDVPQQTDDQMLKVIQSIFPVSKGEPDA